VVPVTRQDFWVILMLSVALVALALGELATIPPGS
jgi:hypothetical protein